MEKLQVYRTAVDAAVYVVDFMLKENFYSRKLHCDLEDFVTHLLDYYHDKVLDHVSPKSDGQ